MKPDLQKWSNLEIGDFFLLNTRVYEKISEDGYHHFPVHNSKGIDNKSVYINPQTRVKKL